MSEGLGDDWRAIWGRRELKDATERPTLGDLVALDGFDNDAGAISEADWLEYARRAAEILGIQDGQAVYEVGCGSGAFLVALSRHAEIAVAGSDYSPALIEVVERALPDGDFSVTDAERIPTTPMFDHVVANSVFFYFQDLDYAERVLDRMLAKSRRTVAVLELPDAALREGAEEFRRARFGAEIYAERYANLSHQYFARQWFKSIADRRGLECQIVPSLIPNYDQGAFRFGSVFRHGK